MVRAKDSFKYRFVDYEDDICWFSLLMFDSLSDVLNIDDGTNEGITESDDDDDDNDDKREENFDNGQNDDIEEYNQTCWQ